MHFTRRFGGTSFFLIAAMLGGCHQQATSTSQQQHPEISPLVKQGQKNASTAMDTPSATPPSVGGDQDVPPAPGTALALAQRAATYAQSLDPSSPVKQPSKITVASREQSPGPDLTRFTPQAQIEPVANQALATEAAPKLSPSTEPIISAASPSVSIPTNQKLVTGDNAASKPAFAGMDALANRIVARAKDYSTDLAAQTDAQVLKFVRDEPVPDLSTMAGLAPEDRELLGALMDSLSNFRNQLRAENNMLFSKKIRPLVELSDRLRGQAELSVPTVALCTKVTAFGSYEPIEPARFVAGKQQQAVVYCEVENFLSQLNEHNEYETKLTQDVVLYTEASGLPVWSDPKSTYDDKSRRRRHDFFMAKIITLPSNLSIGRYLLKVTVEDRQARHIAENMMPIEIVAQ